MARLAGWLLAARYGWLDGWLVPTTTTCSSSSRYTHHHREVSAIQLYSCTAVHNFTSPTFNIAQIPCIATLSTLFSKLRLPWLISWVAAGIVAMLDIQYVVHATSGCQFRRSEVLHRNSLHRPATCLCVKVPPHIQTHRRVPTRLQHLESKAAPLSNPR